jgi:NitT/TauT family transport system substrate-binding protein
VPGRWLNRKELVVLTLKKSAAIAVLLALTNVSAKADEKVKYVLDWFPAGYIGFAYVGIKQGYFKEEGLDVTVEIGRGGSDAVARVAAGADDFGAASLSSLMNAAANNPSLPAKAVLAIYSKSPDAIVTKIGSGIESIKDLDKKSLATATFSGSNQVWPLMAKRNQLDPDKVKFLKVDNNALGPMLATGKVDAVISWVTSVPLYSKLAEESGAKLKTIPWSEFGLSGYNWSLLASEKVIKERPEVAKKFVRAFKKSVEFALAHPDLAGKDVHELAPDTDATTNAVEIEAMRPLVENEISKRTGFGKFDPALVSETWKWVAAAQDYPADKINPESVVDRSLLQ